jgi:hypothetical protein
MVRAITASTAGASSPRSVVTGGGYLDQMDPEGRGIIVATERHPASQSFVKHAAQCVDIGARIHGFA